MQAEAICRCKLYTQTHEVVLLTPSQNGFQMIRKNIIFWSLGHKIKFKNRPSIAVNADGDADGGKLKTKFE